MNPELRKGVASPIRLKSVEVAGKIEHWKAFEALLQGPGVDFDRFELSQRFPGTPRLQIETLP